MALVEGVKYGLSSSSGGNGGLTSSISAQDSKKSLIFVKLTDSALRAIEDYLRSQQKTGQHATLQFLGNEGRINIPSSQAQAYNGHSFDFSLQSNADIEGPQGSFECIQQCASSSLESMGTLPFKMRIHAKEDIYEATRQRINALEEERLHDCAKEIKNGADIGRKVKKKIIGSIASLPHRRETSPIYNNHTKSSLLSHNTSNKKLNNGYYTNHNHTANINNHIGGHSLSNNHASPNNLKTNTISNSANKANIGIGGDISRRPLRDRIIHLLAVKPCKKPELVTRLNRDGLKDKDKKLLMATLLQISSMKGNEYFLNRGIWNDVQEDWPFFTEQERQMMKRRKPQNLTPTGSDCSVGSATSGSSLSPRSSTSGSGHSPPTFASNNNYHHSNGTNGMTQYGVKPNTPNGTQQFYDQNGLNPASKRPGILEGPDNIPSKRQRISHFKRPNCSSVGGGANAPQPDLIGSPNQVKESTLPYNGTSHSYSQSAGHLNGYRLSPPGNANTGTGQIQKSPRNFDSRNPTGGKSNNDVSHLILSPPYGGPTPEEMVGIGNYAPYVWSARNDLVGFGGDSKLPDSDETDSVDSGNGSSSGSSSSGSAHHQSIKPTTNSVNKMYSSYGAPLSNGQSLDKLTNIAVPATSISPSSSSKPPTPTYPGSDNMNGHAIPHGYGPCNRVSSTTTGTGLTPQCSPDSQVEAFQQKQQQTSQESPEISLFNDRTSNRERERRNRDRDSVNRRDGKKDKERDRQVKANYDCPSYVGTYTKIRTPEERARYKSDFNIEYGEYRNLHHVIDKVSKTFAHLEERLRQQEHGSDGYQAVKEEIVNEYYSNKKNKKYQETKQKFTYLHDKLSHIKKLVVEFDNAHSADQSDYGSRDDDYNDF